MLHRFVVIISSFQNSQLFSTFCFSFSYGAIVSHQFYVFITTVGCGALHIYTIDQVILSSPVLNEGELESLLKDPILKPQVLRTFFDIRKGVEGSLEKTLNRLCEAADEAVRNGSQLLILSDRSDEPVHVLVLFVLALLLAVCMMQYFR
jgi:hypothetical protein